MQDLGFAQGGVADVDPERIVGGRPCRRYRSYRAGRWNILRRRIGLRPLARERRLACEAEVEDVPLHRGEPAGAVRRHEVLLPLHALALDEGVERIAPRPPPRRQQLVALGEVARIGVAASVPAGDLAPRADVAPVLPARDEHEQVDLDPLRGPAQHVEVRGREGGHREEGRAPGPAGGADAGGKPFPEGVDGRNPVAGRGFPPFPDQAPP